MASTKVALVHPPATPFAAPASAPIEANQIEVERLRDRHHGVGGK